MTDLQPPSLFAPEDRERPRWFERLGKFVPPLIGGGLLAWILHSAGAPNWVLLLSFGGTFVSADFESKWAEEREAAAAWREQQEAHWEWLHEWAESQRR